VAMTGPQSLHPQARTKGLISDPQKH